jgi:hypothetical protein
MENNNHSNLLEKTAKTISVVFHPLLIPLYGMIIIFSSPTFFWYVPFKVKGILLLIIATNNIIIPITLMPFFRYRNIISSWLIETRKDRIAPLITVSMFYIITSFIMLRLPIPFFIKAYVFSTSLVVIAVTVINFWWKISIHSVGAGALAGIVIVLSFAMTVPLTWFLIPVILISGLILSSRLKLNSNNVREVYIGFLSGFVGINLFMLLF